MLVHFKDEQEKHVVMGMIIDSQQNQVFIVFSEFGNVHGQYPQKIEDVVIIDQHLSIDWVVSKDHRKQELIITFPEWANDLGEHNKPGFYERYLDGDPDALRVMSEHYLIECEKYKDVDGLFEQRVKPQNLKNSL